MVEARRRDPTVALAAASLLVACTSSAPRADAPAGGTMAGGPVGHEQTPGSADRGAPADASAPSAANGAPGDASDANATDGPAGDEASGDVASPPPDDASVDAASPPRCDPAHAWTAAAAVPFAPAPAVARFGGVSADELTVAWTASDGTPYVATRTDRNAAFGAPTAVAAGSPLANDRVALAPTGVVLFAVAADRGSFLAFDRSAADAGFSPSTSLQLAAVNAMTSDGGGQFFEPALGADGASFFYLFARAGAAPVLYESAWDARQHAWTAGSALASPELASSDATHRRRPTGASSDGRTLFFFDETAGRQRAAWRDSPASAFDRFVDLSGVPEGAPNYLCDALYFEAPSAGATTLSIAR